MSKLLYLQAGQSALGSPSSYFFPAPSKWDSLPEPIMHIIFSRVDLRGQQNCRLVSKYWKHLINNNLKVGRVASAPFVSQNGEVRNTSVLCLLLNTDTRHV